jgi:hypothetical protein
MNTKKTLGECKRLTEKQARRLQEARTTVRRHVYKLVFIGTALVGSIVAPIAAVFSGKHDRPDDPTSALVKPSDGSSREILPQRFGSAASAIEKAGLGTVITRHTSASKRDPQLIVLYQHHVGGKVHHDEDVESLFEAYSAIQIAVDHGLRSIAVEGTSSDEAIKPAVLLLSMDPASGKAELHPWGTETNEPRLVDGTPARVASAEEARAILADRRNFTAMLTSLSKNAAGDQLGAILRMALPPHVRMIGAEDRHLHAKMLDEQSAGEKAFLEISGSFFAAYERAGKWTPQYDNRGHLQKLIVHDHHFQADAVERMLHYIAEDIEDEKQRQRERYAMNLPVEAVLFGSAHGTFFMKNPHDRPLLVMEPKHIGTDLERLRNLAKDLLRQLRKEKERFSTPAPSHPR